MSLLTIAQTVADYTGFERPSTVVGNTDPIARQLLVFINREGKQLMRATNWPILSKEHTFNTANGTQNYALPTDFDRFVSGTAYNRTDLNQLAGPITPQQYQADRFGTTTGGVVERFRLKPSSNALRFDLTPTPTATESIGFEYISSHWNQTSGGTSQAAMAADTDVGILDEALIEMGVTWRFKQNHGLAYDEDFRQYQLELRQAISRSGGAPIITMDDARKYLVDPYSYNLPDSGYGG
tara:strand:- start:10 stop:726 length:717 start_codon:yes stop_codon:yes gene_type:complete